MTISASYTTQRDSIGLEETIDLYRVMHDAKFAGYPQTLDHAELGHLLTQVPLVSDDLDPSELLPLLRGVREFSRFGDGRVLSPIFSNFRVNREEKDAFQNSRGTVAGLCCTVRLMRPRDSHPQPTSRARTIR